MDKERYQTHMTGNINLIASSTYSQPPGVEIEY
jgi:hypothetical protein